MLKMSNDKTEWPNSYILPYFILSGKEDDFFFNLKKNIWSDRILGYGIVALLIDNMVVMTDRKKSTTKEKIKQGSTSMGLRSRNKLMRRMQAIPSVLIST